MKAWLFSIGAAIIIFCMIEGILVMSWALTTLYWWCASIHPVIFIFAFIALITALSYLLRHTMFDDED